MYAFHILARVVENRRINQMAKGEFVLLLARDRVNESHSKYKNNMISTYEISVLAQVFRKSSH